jgi:ABC-type sugar transport system permease subunit
LGRHRAIRQVKTSEWAKMMAATKSGWRLRVFRSPVHSINAAAYLIVLPAILIRAIFTLAPLAQTFWMSMTDKSIMRPGKFIGLDNYVAMLSDQTLWSTFAFTAIYTALSVIIQTALGLAFALLLTQNLRGKWITNFALLLPWLIAPLLAAVIFKILYYEQGGIINELLTRLGLITQPIRWLSDGFTAKISVILLTVWKNVSWVTLIYIAGITALPKDLYEAARVDGANAFHRFTTLTVPLLMPTTYLILMLRAMGEVQTFEQINGLTRGGPGTATQTLAVYAYRRFFQELQYGYGSAINVLLFLSTVCIGAFFAWRLLHATR